MKRVIIVGLVIVVGLLCFLVGQENALRGIGQYEVYGTSFVFRRDLPTQGLPLMEYSGVLSSLRNGEIPEATVKLEALLDLSVYGAMQRRKVLTGADLSKLDNALLSVAQYRADYQRAIEDSADGEVLRVKREVDVFLDNLLSSRTQAEEVVP